MRFKRLGGIVIDNDKVMTFICGLPEDYKESKKEHADDSLGEVLQFCRKLAAKEKPIEQKQAVTVVPETLHRVVQHKSVPGGNASRSKQQVI